VAVNKYDEIAQAAIRLFNEKGYHATSVQDIADEVGLQKGSLYHYIASKEELLLQIASRSMHGFSRELAEICELDIPATERLRRAIHHHFDIVTGDTQMTTVLLREAFLLSESERIVIQQAMDQYTNLWVRIIQEGMESGEFKRQDPRLVALHILGSCNWVYRWYRPGGALRPTEIAEQFFDLHFSGLQSSPSN